MKFLFVHQNFPGQFLHIVRKLVADPRHEVLFITEPNANQIAGMRKIPYARPQLDIPETHFYARELDNGVRRAEAVGRAAHGLKYLGFRPDIIIGHHGWGEMLNLPEIWPGVPMLGYLEFYYQCDKADVGFDPEFPSDPLDYPRIRAKNAINHIALNLGSTGQTPTKWQLSTYPDWARPGIELLWEGVDLRTCAPDPQVRKKNLRIGDMMVWPGDKLVTYVSRDLEPYRGFHIMMRALPALMRARKDIKVVLVGGDGISYGSGPRQGGNWREVMLAEIGKDIDRDRVVFPGRIPYSTDVSMLQRSDAHVYLTYPFVASWSLRESLAVGCPIVGSSTEPVQEFITHGDNGLLVPFLKPQKLACTVLDLLDDKALTRRLRANARAYAEKNLAMDDYLANYCRLIERLTGENPAAPAQPAVLVPRCRPARPADAGQAAAPQNVMPRRKKLVTAA